MADPRIEPIGLRRADEQPLQKHRHRLLQRSACRIGGVGERVPLGELDQRDPVSEREQEPFVEHPHAVVVAQHRALLEPLDAQRVENRPAPVVAVGRGWRLEAATQVHRAAQPGQGEFLDVDRRRDEDALLLEALQRPVLVGRQDVGRRRPIGPALSWALWAARQRWQTIRAGQRHQLVAIVGAGRRPECRRRVRRRVRIVRVETPRREWTGGRLVAVVGEDIGFEVRGMDSAERRSAGALLDDEACGPERREGLIVPLRRPPSRRREARGLVGRQREARRDLDGGAERIKRARDLAHHLIEPVGQDLARFDPMVPQLGDQLIRWRRQSAGLLRLPCREGVRRRRHDGL